MNLSMKSSTKHLEESRNFASPSSSSCSYINGTGSLHHHIVTRSDHYPTTFVQADTSSFKHVVQMLTGSSSSSPRSPDSPSPPATTSAGKGNFIIPPIKTVPPKKQTGFKLYERRHNLKNSFMINTLMIGGGGGGGFNGSSGFSPRNPEILSPSCLDFPKLGLNSPVTPLKNEGDPFDKMSPLSNEERAIAEKGFYLHPSPISTPRDSEPPQLLPLFPVTSPKVSPEESN
ncbi:PREDICTED: VQ motif-containing protein 19-like [Tarenaya hassleriana]|uniref:VQ motif-containing protein 19-like n=1 Tax=Tarenaya hassleriana TaxID=28532 RepID=UPI00053CA956|nr:PREDICTED: VQ motif-containing protein 19-like [Tarenaya hassleriana]